MRAVAAAVKMAPAPVPMAHPGFHPGHGIGGGKLVADERQEAVGIIVVDDRKELCPGDLLDRIAEHLLHRRALIDHTAARVHDGEEVWRICTRDRNRASLLPNARLAFSSSKVRVSRFLATYAFSCSDRPIRESAIELTSFAMPATSNGPVIGLRASTSPAAITARGAALGGQPLDNGGEAIDEPYFVHQYQGCVDHVHNAVPVHVPVRLAGQIGE